MKTLLCCVFSSLLIVFPRLALAQVQIAFDPCRPAKGELVGDFVPLCPEELSGVGIVIRGASADTHQDLIEDIVVDNLVTLSNERLAILQRGLMATNRYDDVSILPSIGLVEITLIEKPRIAGVQFIGGEALDIEQLEDLVPLELGSPLSEERIIEFAQDILSQYPGLGYFSAQLEPFLISESSFAFANGVTVSMEIDEGAIAPVLPIRFSGNTTFSDAQLLDLIVDAKTWQTADQVDVDLLSIDQNNILQAYADEGLGRTSLSIQIATYNAQGQELAKGDRPASVGLVFEINEEAFEIGEVIVIGGEDEEEAVHEIAEGQTSSLQSGEAFNPELVLQEAQALSEQLNSISDFDLVVSPVFAVDPQTNAMNISFVVSRIPPRELISIRFVGNDQTVESYMRRIMNVAVGDTLESRDVRNAISRLGSTGLFEDISVSEDTAPEEKLALVITVVERKTGVQSLGATYSTRTGFSMRLGVEERNWLGRGLYAGTTANFSESTQTFDFFLNPPSLELTDSIKIENQLRFTVSNSDSERYRTNTLSWTAQYNRSLPAQIVETPSFSLTSSQITHADSEASSAIRADKGVLKTQATLGYALSRRVLRGDDLPLDGTNYAFRTTFSFPITEDNYAHMSARADVYRVLDEADRAVFSLRSSFDFVGAITGGSLPTGARLSNPTVLVRGFESGGIGPREIGNDNAYGGTTTFGSSLSLRYKLLNHPRLPIYGSIYIDAGTVFDAGSDFTYDNNGTAVSVRDSNILRVSSGFGVVLQTDVGAITFTLSDPHVKADFDKVEELQFGFGANL